MEAMEPTVNPLHIMDDGELISRFKLADLESPEFKEYRQELLYRLRKGNLDSWTPPQRKSAPPIKGS
jgi:hypothetical protein